MLLLQLELAMLLLAMLVQPPLELAAYVEDWGDSEGDIRWSGLRQTSDLTWKERVVDEKKSNF